MARAVFIRSVYGMPPGGGQPQVYAAGRTICDTAANAANNGWGLASSAGFVHWPPDVVWPAFIGDPATLPLNADAQTHYPLPGGGFVQIPTTSDQIINACQGGGISMTWGQ
jgi:hypothetical protein